MSLPRLMLVTDRLRIRGRELARIVVDAVAGGVGIVQIREKDLADDTLRALVGRIREKVGPSTLLVVNGRVEVARAEGCGLHLPAAVPLPERRELSLIGRSVHDVDEARRALAEGVDYLVVGPIYPTPSKPGHPGWGVDLIRDTLDLAGAIPIFAIGGIHPCNVPEVVHAGAWGVAVSGAILSAADPGRAGQALSLALDVARRGHGGSS